MPCDCGLGIRGKPRESSGLNGDFSAAKHALRKEMRERLATLSDVRRVEESTALAEMLRRDPDWTTASRVFAYLPLPDEPDYFPALLPGQLLHLPRRSENGDSMSGLSFRCAPRHDTARSAGGIDAPIEWFEDTPRRGDVVLVPGLAFTGEGLRLGRGGGCYDRWLAGLPTDGPTVLGICFSVQLVAGLPVEPHDQRVRRVLCAGGQ